MTIPLSEATRRNPLMINSLAMITRTTITFSLFIDVRQISAVHTSSLSASGSINLPKFVTRLYFLAIFPSSISVRLATQKITSAIHLSAAPVISNNINTTKNGIKITRKIVNLFGKFIITLLSNHNLPIRSLLPLQNLLTSVLPMCSQK